MNIITKYLPFIYQAKNLLQPVSTVILLKDETSYFTGQKAGYSTIVAILQPIYTLYP